MKIMDPGHWYKLDSLDGDNSQTLMFVKREGPHYPGNVGHHPGTTMQEVLRVLIDRAIYVNSQIPCIETEMAIEEMQHALVLFEIRAKRVKGTYLSEITIENVEKAPICGECGHVGTSHDHRH